MSYRSLSAGAVCALLVMATPALAVSNQTWVSVTGADSGACPIATPCRTFAYAYSQTAANGVINVANSGEYGPLVITQSISIVSDGAVAAIHSAVSGAAIRIGGANIEVSLKGLTIDLFGSTNLGINFIKGQALHITDCTIRGTGVGIRFAPITSGTAELFVTNTLMTKMVGDGLQVVPSGGAYAKAMIERTRVENAGGDGMAFIGTSGAINATVRDSVASGNNASGITAAGNSGSPLNVMLNRAAAINNGNSGIVSNSAQIRIGDSVVSGNNLGLFPTAGGTIMSYGNNQINGNFSGGDGLPTSSVAFK